jgi:hypothetical protein
MLPVALALMGQHVQIVREVLFTSATTTTLTGLRAVI